MGNSILLDVYVKSLDIYVDYLLVLRIVQKIIRTTRGSMSVEIPEVPHDILIPTMMISIISDI